MDKKASTYLSYVAANLRQLKGRLAAYPHRQDPIEPSIPSDRFRPLLHTSRTYFVGLKFRSYKFSPFEELCSAVLFIAGLDEVEHIRRNSQRGAYV
jgi:hypothetical protein